MDNGGGINAELSRLRQEIEELKQERNKFKDLYEQSCSPRQRDHVPVARDVYVRQLYDTNSSVVYEQTSQPLYAKQTTDASMMYQSEYANLMDLDRSKVYQESPLSGAFVMATNHEGSNGTRVEGEGAPPPHAPNSPQDQNYNLSSLSHQSISGASSRAPTARSLMPSHAQIQESPSVHPSIYAVSHPWNHPPPGGPLGLRHGYTHTTQEYNVPVPNITTVDHTWTPPSNLTPHANTRPNFMSSQNGPAHQSPRSMRSSIHANESSPNAGLHSSRNHWDTGANSATVRTPPRCGTPTHIRGANSSPSWVPNRPRGARSRSHSLSVASAISDDPTQFDTTLKAGFFKVKESNACKFSKEERFRPPVGTPPGHYIFARNYKEMQDAAKSRPRSRSAALKLSRQVVPHWNTVESQSPGPGAYSPSWSCSTGFRQ
uniref:Uncharacterized protein n=1 Tax=Eutreptiella gymnastica TaxID=73025 RepID=A0A7S1JG66_9EUGL